MYVCVNGHRPKYCVLKCMCVCIYIYVRVLGTLVYKI